MAPRVLFVSKPIGPPYHDGTKCLVRDVAGALTRYQALVMTRGNGAPLGPRVDHASVYTSAGGYTPQVTENARAALWLLTSPRAAADLWHFVFAPNPRTSTVGHVARRVRRVPVVQTVASPPQSFAAGLFFGDRVVAQSQWTRARILEAFAQAGRSPPDVAVIPPPVGELAPPTTDAVDRVRSQLRLERDARVFVYPGDLEVSRGAETVARAVPQIIAGVPGAVVVFACRQKTPAAPAIEAGLRARLPAGDVRFARETDLPALLSTSVAVLFPVDDLRGKVDIPISLLEAMQLGIPVVTPDTGPTAELSGALRVPVDDAGLLAALAIRLANDRTFAAEVASAARDAVGKNHSAAAVAGAYERVYDEVLARGGSSGVSS